MTSGKLPRVLHVISTLDPAGGGPPQALLGLSTAQRELGQSIDVCTVVAPDGDSRFIEALRVKGIRVHTAPKRSSIGPQKAVAQILRSLMADVDILHIHAIWEPIQHAAAVEARRVRKPYVFRPCGMLDPYSLRVGRAWAKQIYLTVRLRRDLNHAAAIHYTSVLERELVAPLGLHSPAVVEPNGITVAEFETLPPAGAFRSRFPKLIDRPMALFLSRVHPKKGLDFLIPAFAQGAPPDAMLVIAGPSEASYQNHLENLVARNRLTDRVVFTGMLHGPERIAAFADADLFVLPSHQENFGIAVVESLAAGTPVLISDQVNIFREIEAAGVGEAVPMQVASLAAALGAWLTDGSRRAAAAEKARPLIWTRYDWRAIAQRWAKHYEGLIKG